MRRADEREVERTDGRERERTKKDYRCGASVRSGNKSDCVRASGQIIRYYAGVSVYQLREEAGMRERDRERRHIFSRTHRVSLVHSMHGTTQTKRASESFWRIERLQPPTRPRSISLIIVSRFQVLHDQVTASSRKSLLVLCLSLPLSFSFSFYFSICLCLSWDYSPPTRHR